MDNAEHSKFGLGAIVLAILVTAVVVGTAVYLWQNSKKETSVGKRLNPDEINLTVPEGDPARCETSSQCYPGYESRFEQVYDGKVCLQ